MVDKIAESSKANFDRVNSQGRMEQRPTKTYTQESCGDKCPNSDRHITIHRSWRSVLPALLVFFAFSIFSVIISQSQPELVFRSKFEFLNTTFLISMPILGLICAVLLVRPLFLMYDCYHEIGCHHIRSTEGRCSFRKSVIEISFEDLRGVRVQQNLLERFLGVGTILVGTSITDRPQVHFHGVGEPAQYARTIMHQIDDSHKKTNSTSD